MQEFCQIPLDSGQNQWRSGKYWIIYALIKLAEFFILPFQMGAGTEYGKKPLTS